MKQNIERLLFQLDSSYSEKIQENAIKELSKEVDLTIFLQQVVPYS